MPLEVPIKLSNPTTNKDIDYYEKSIEKMYKDKIAPHDSFELKSDSSKVLISCKPCSMASKGKKERLIDAGPISKALSNLKAHIKTGSHATNVVRFVQNIEKSKSKEDEQDDETKLKLHFKEVQKKFEGKFELLNLGSERGKCRCKACNLLISLMPERGNYMVNIEAHNQSCTGAKRAEKRRQQGIESFVTVSKKQKTQ